MPLKRMDQDEMARLLDGRRRDGKSRHRPARSRLRDLQGVAPFARGFERPETAHRHVSLARTDRRGQDLARQDAGRTDVRRFQIAHPPGHERIHGATQCLAPHRLAARLCRLRGRRPAHGKSAAQSVFRGAVRRNRKGASGCLEHAVADSGRRQIDRQRGPRGQFPQHHHLDDLERRLGHDQPAVHAGLFADHRRGQLRKDAANGSWTRPRRRSARSF